MIKQLIINLLLYIIELLDRSNIQEEKLVDSHLINGIMVKSESGWSPIAYIHQTKPYTIYELTTEYGKTLQAADEHLIFDDKMNCKWLVDYKVGDYIMTIDGPEQISSIKKLSRTVSMCDITVFNDNESYYSNGILSHNTTTSAIFLLHYILFNFDKTALVLGNIRKTSVEIMDKIKKIFYEIPYFLKPGVYKWNETEIAFDNGCRCLGSATTTNSGISFTVHCVLADEFAHIQPNILDKFYNNLFPVITAGKARFIISSTQNGFNLFYRLYKAAEAGENDYAPFKVDWWQVPEWNPEEQKWEKRDEEWHRRQVANYGSEEAFNKQFGTDFDVTSGTLINPKLIKKFQQESVEYKSIDMPGIYLSQYYFWHPLYNIMELRNDFFIITVDISEGGGGDYTVFCFNKMVRNERNEIEYETVGYFRCNTFDIQNCVKSLYSLCANFMDMNKYTISVELNMYGDLFVYNFKDEILKNPQNFGIINEDIFCKYYNDTGSKFSHGIKMTHATKSHACMRFKNDYEHRQIRNYDTEFLREVVNFSDSSGNGSFKASYGHDDFVMAQVQLELAKDTLSARALIDQIGANVDNNNDNYDIYGGSYGSSAMPSGMYGSSAMPSGMYGNGQMFGGGFDMYGGSSIDPTLSRLSRF